MSVGEARGRFLGRVIRLAGAALALGLGSAAQAQNANLTSLHDALQLGPTQESAWRSYVSATAPDPRAQDRRAATGRLLPTLPTPRRIDLISAAMEQDLTDFRAKAQAVKFFYGQLSPAQRAMFDRQTLALSGDRPASGQATRPPQ